VNLEKIQAIQRSFTSQMVIRFADIDRKIRVSRAYEHLFKAM
jgi:DNA-binding LytR/AlgR family response regulator